MPNYVQIPGGALPVASWPQGALVFGITWSASWDDSIQIPHNALPNGAWPQLALVRSIAPEGWRDSIQVPHKALPDSAWPQLALVRSITYVPPQPDVATPGCGAREFYFEPCEAEEILLTVFPAIWRTITS